jgi:cellobiose phosphorylase
VDGFDTSRDAFIGVYNGFENPKAAVEGECTNSIANGWYPIGVHQVNISLEAGESKRLHFILGYMENKEEEKFFAPNVINKKSLWPKLKAYKNAKDIDKALKELKRYWSELLGKYRVEIDNKHVERMVNVWNQYQCMVTFNLSRSASFYETGIGRGLGSAWFCTYDT